MTWHQPIITTLGFGGALFHVWNHAIFKGLLFLGAGHVVHATHTREIDRLGGLFKTMPVVGGMFLVASAAICGLPPFNGFVSEWLLYLGLFHGAQSFSHFSLFVSIAGIVGIAFAGALAVACFTKVFGVIFLGEPRSELGKAAHEASISLLFPMGVLAFLCLAIGLYPQAIWPYTQSVLEGFIPHSNLLPLEGTTLALANVSGFFLFFTGLLLFLLLIYRVLVWRKKLRRTVTWDCAYPAPTPRMQYTASSFAEPLQYFFSPLLKPHVQFKKPLGYFPVVEKFEEHTEDLAERTLFAPLFAKTARLFAWVKGLQRSRVQNYLALIFVTLILLLLGEVWFGL